MKGMHANPSLIEMLHDYYIRVWELTAGTERNDENTTNHKNLSMFTLVEIFTIEAFQQRELGETRGSTFILDLLDNSIVSFGNAQLKFVVQALQKAAYQGIPEFVVKTLLLSEFRVVWERRDYSAVIEILSSLRSIYQEEIDSVLLSKEPANQNLFQQVRVSASLPNTADVLFMNSLNWILAPAVEINITKICGNLMLDLADSQSVDEFLTKAPRTLINALFDFDLINITHIHWRKIHNPAWDEYEKWKISRDLDDRYPEIHLYWSEYVKRFIAENGRGIMFENP